MEIPITLLSTGILGILFFIHSLRTIKGRSITETSLGDGGDELMTRRIRIHGNFAEYIPLLLIILLLLEVSKVGIVLLVTFAASIILGRLLHFYGLYSKETPFWARIAGMQLTLWPLLLGSVYLILISVL